MACYMCVRPTLAAEPRFFRHLASFTPHVSEPEAMRHGRSGRSRVFQSICAGLQKGPAHLGENRGVLNLLSHAPRGVAQYAPYGKNNHAELSCPAAQANRISAAIPKERLGSQSHATGSPRKNPYQEYRRDAIHDKDHSPSPFWLKRPFPSRR